MNILLKVVYYIRLIFQCLISKILYTSSSIIHHEDEVRKLMLIIYELYPSVDGTDMIIWIRINRFTKNISFHIKFVSNEKIMDFYFINNCYQISCDNKAIVVKKGEIKKLKEKSKILEKEIFSVLEA